MHVGDRIVKDDSNEYTSEILKGQ